MIGTTKRKKVRIVDFGDTLTEILKAARREQLKSRMQYGELYHRNYYKEVHVKNRVYYEYYHLDGTQEVPADYKEISFVCLRPDGSLELPSTLGIVCRSVSKKLEGFEDFHFHQLRHPYVKHTTKKYNSEKQKTQATKIVDLIAWGFCFCIVSYSKRSWTL